MRESVMVTDANLDPPGPRILFVNRAFCEMTGHRREEVVSTQAGLILCLRVFNRVHQGDSLAAVLELDPSQ